MKKISIVIPAYNEENNLAVIFHRIREVFHQLPAYSYEVIFVNDGSHDHTKVNLERMAEEFSEIKFINFSRNFGHQPAVKAGIDHAKGDAVISMDADLQHPPELIPQLIEKWEEGFDVVYTIRTYSEDISFIKRLTSDVFYRLLSSLSDVHLEKGAGADFRLLDARVVEVLRDMEETDIFLRGSVKWVGFDKAGIPFTAEDRFSGQSKYGLVKMIRLAFTGITAFSIKPLYLAAYLGFFFSVFSIVFFSSYVLWATYQGTRISGWASLIMTVVFFGGMQLTVMGIIGIYLGKAFKQIKGRPNYIIKNKNF